MNHILHLGQLIGYVHFDDFDKFSTAYTTLQVSRTLLVHVQMVVRLVHLVTTKLIINMCRE